jgi:hypothetical protein
LMVVSCGLAVYVAGLAAAAVTASPVT